jgi:hypothetical protein
MKVRNQKTSRAFRAALAVAGSLVLGISSASAQLTWNASAGNGTWQVGTGGWLNTSNASVNWADGNTAIFGGTDGTYTISVGGNISLATGNSGVAGLRFNNSGYTLSATSSRTVFMPN